jgi:hypothetical protein
MLVIGCLLCAILRGCLCDAGVNVHALAEGKSYYTRDSFCEKIEHVFDQFHKYQLNILVDDFSTKVGREDIFRSTIGNESSGNDNGVRAVNFAISKNLIVKSMFPDHKFHKYTWTCTDGKENLRLIAS